MNIVVAVKQVPDLVEELEIAPDGTGLDRTWMTYILNELDDHALEQALLLKKRHGGQVTVLTLDMGDVDDSLFAAAAKGADRLIKVADDFEEGVDCHTAARVFADTICGLEFDLVLTGVQAVDDLDGQVAPLLAGYLGLPYVGVVTSVTVDEAARTATVQKEFPGGLLAELEVDLPAVLGVQAAEQPPRYVPVSRLRQAMRTAAIEETTTEVTGDGAGLLVRRAYKPEPAERAEIIAGTPEEVAERILEILRERGIA